jgi:hypothetical protein
MNGILQIHFVASLSMGCEAEFLLATALGAQAGAHARFVPVDNICLDSPVTPANFRQGFPVSVVT